MKAERQWCVALPTCIKRHAVELERGRIFPRQAELRVIAVVVVACAALACSVGRYQLFQGSMPPNRARRTALSERACLQCQKRKTRCIPRGADQTCEYCEKSQRECTFPERPPKTPLTRKNLEDAESRCEELESLLDKYRGTRPEANGVRESEAGLAQGNDAVQGSAHNVSGSYRDTAVDASPYEWDETLAGEGVSAGTGHMQDGMVSLGGSNVGTGYLGKCLGSRDRAVFLILDSRNNFRACYVGNHLLRTFARRIVEHASDPATRSTTLQHHSSTIS